MSCKNLRRHSTCVRTRLIPWAPEWSGHVALIGNHEIAEGELFGMAAYHFQTKQEAGWEPDSFSVSGYGELNLSLGYRLGQYSVTAYASTTRPMRTTTTAVATAIRYSWPSSSVPAGLAPWA